MVGVGVGNVDDLCQYSSLNGGGGRGRHIVGQLNVIMALAGLCLLCKYIRFMMEVRKLRGPGWQHDGDTSSKHTAKQQCEIS